MTAAYHRATGLVLRLLRVPPEPQPPHGDPASLRVFRAGHNHLKLKLIGWGIGQLAAFAGILFWLWIFVDLELAADEIRHRQTQTQAAPVPPAPPAETTQPTSATAATSEPSSPPKKAARKKRVSGNSYAAWKSGTAQVLARLPLWVFPLLWFLKIAGIIAYFAQLPLTYAIARLDFDLRWYMVTDRSLRIRHGLWKINESTMSFANIQQVVVTQGPVQRLLKLADLRVSSAGGGGSDEHQAQADDAMHTGLFHNVTNADEIRDLIQERLRRFRESGLGDPEEKTPVPDSVAATGPGHELIAAARGLADEARALRREITG